MVKPIELEKKGYYELGLIKSIRIYYRRIKYLQEYIQNNQKQNCKPS